MLLGRGPFAVPDAAGVDTYQLRLIWLGVVPFADATSPDAAGPPAWRLSFLDGPGASLEIGEKRISFPGGRAILIPPGSTDAKPEGDVPQLLVQFQLRLAAVEHAAALGAAPIVLPPDELRDRLCGRLRRDLEASSTASAATCSRAKALVNLSVAAAFDLRRDVLDDGERDDDAERQLRPVLRYIDEHLEDPLDNARLAAFVHASESHFIRMFRRVVGCTPARHVQERRVQQAAELLSQTNLTIDEIAERCGFANRFHFSRVFAQRMVEPPGRYRASHGRRLESGIEAGNPSASESGIAR
jgi:AraC-like DNA-binding protein